MHTEYSLNSLSGESRDFNDNVTPITQNTVSTHAGSFICCFEVFVTEIFVVT